MEDRAKWHTGRDITLSVDITVGMLRETVSVLLAISLPLLLVGLVVGVLVGIIQAATQIQETSLVFVPKLLAVVCTFWLAAPWLSDKLMRFIRLVFDQVAQVGSSGGLGL